MEPRFVIKNHSDINYVTNYLNKNHAEAAIEGKPLVVTIKPDERNRSKAQNRLYWKWLPSKSLKPSLMNITNQKLLS
ncbi:hypothetical protein F4T72_15640 [Acinetobacter pittii]|nr:hypothetical protein [Acinetobacter pittii]